VFEWLKRFRKVAKQLTVAARSEEKSARNTKAINLKPYTPEPKAFLGQLAYLQLSNFEILTAALKYSPNTQYKAELSEAAARSFDKYRQLSKKLVELGADTSRADESIQGTNCCFSFKHEPGSTGTKLSSRSI